MAQLVTAILSHQDALSAKARQHIGDDFNEASLLVGRVMSRALTTMDKDTPASTVSATLRRDLERLLAQHRLT